MKDREIYRTTDNERPVSLRGQSPELPAEKKTLPPSESERDEYLDRRPKKKTRAGRIFVRVVELLAIALSFLGRSQIARFLTAKVSMDVLVEVTDRFGPKAGHRLSTVMALIVAEPHIIALAVTGIILVLELVYLVIHLIRNRGRHRKHRRRTGNWE